MKRETSGRLCGRWRRTIQLVMIARPNQDHTDDGREEDKDYGLDPAVKDERFESGMSDSGAAIAAD